MLGSKADRVVASGPLRTEGAKIVIAMVCGFWCEDPPAFAKAKSFKDGDKNVVVPKSIHSLGLSNSFLRVIASNHAPSS